MIDAAATAQHPQPMKSRFPTRTSRRRFLQAGAATVWLPSLIPASVLGADAPSKRIHVGCVGVGPQGRGVMSNFLPQADCRVVALCDVSQRHLAEAVKMVNAAYRDNAVQTLYDYRELVARPEIDALLIATPDHWHVPIALAAARAGKDLYLEKPMGLSVEEDQLLRQVCQEKRVIFQFGTQQRSSQQFRLACELVRNGRIGRLKHINVWCSASKPGGSTAPAQPPADLDYELWLGPAPQTPYTLGKAYDEGGAWKTWWFNYDYALGFIAGWGVHPLDIAYWGHPDMMRGVLEVSGPGEIPREGACNTSVAWDVKFQFADGVTLHHRGTPNGAAPSPLNDLSEWQRKYTQIVDHGTAFEGTDGWVLVDRTQIRTQPDQLIETKFGDADHLLPKSSNHVRNFLDAIKSRRPAICPIEDSVQADILCHLSDIATRVNRPLKWDPQREQFVGDADANQRLKLRPQRARYAIKSA
jgi:predicted dehydrogenase